MTLEAGAEGLPDKQSLGRGFLRQQRLPALHPPGEGTRVGSGILQREPRSVCLRSEQKECKQRAHHEGCDYSKSKPGTETGVARAQPKHAQDDRDPYRAML